MSVELWRMTAAQLRDGYRAKAFTPIEVLTSVEQRIAVSNPVINAIIAQNEAAALAQAQASTARWLSGRPLSAIDGVPLTIKDNLLLSGMPATWGSRLHKGFTPLEDELPIARLRAAGAVFIGKTNVPEFTLQGYASNLLFGVTRNPHALDMTPGGSTGGGAAAVAAGLGPVAIGTDGGGSLRRPAAHCGLFAFKPSIGQAPRHGGFPQILADFEVVGPVARSLEDLTSVFNTLKGHDPLDPSSLAALAPAEPFSSRVRVAYLPRMGSAPVDPLIAAAADVFARDLEKAGHHVETIQTPYDVDRVSAAWSTVAAAGLNWHLNALGERGGIGVNAQTLDALGAARTAADYVDAMAVTMAARAEAGQFFSRFDILLCPSIAALAWPADEAFPTQIDGKLVGPRGHAVFTGWMNVTGVAAINVPVAMTADRGGIGMQLVCAPGRDSALLEFVRGLSWVKSAGPSLLAA
jgi:aspartyl-tRNA(Asn)/glutamyl-tRNA(Gln) amidotransferase subunit A